MLYNKRMFKKWAYLLSGTITLIIGLVAFIVPLLPAFPFLLLTFILYSKSSDKMVNWFMGTALYKQNLESYLEGQGLTIGSKIRIMLTITLAMAIGAFFSRRIPWVLILLGGIWLFHAVYFSFFVKTKSDVEVNKY